MASYTKFQSFVEAICEKKHDLGADQLRCAFTTLANAPDGATDAVLTDLTTISTANMDTTAIVRTSSSQTGGTYTLVLQDLVITATGAVPTFRYVVIYNDTAASDELIAFFDYGSDVTLALDETFTLNFGAQLFSLT